VLKGRLLPSAQSSALSPHGLIPTTNARRLMPSNRAVGLPPSFPPPSILNRRRSQLLPSQRELFSPMTNTWGAIRQLVWGGPRSDTSSVSRSREGRLIPCQRPEYSFSPWGYRYVLGRTPLRTWWLKHTSYRPLLYPRFYRFLSCFF